MSESYHVHAAGTYRVDPGPFLRVKCYGSTAGFQPTGAGSTPATRTSLPPQHDGRAPISYVGGFSSTLNGGSISLRL